MSRSSKLMYTGLPFCLAVMVLDPHAFGYGAVVLAGVGLTIVGGWFWWRDRT